MADSVNTEYQVNIPVFEGPMDLLLHLVTKNRIDIHDIPIQSITSQYLDYLNAASEFDLELGSSFFAMAATLLFIKSRVLLPKRRQEETGDESEQEDPRGELARSLETFQMIKEVRRRISELMEEERPYHGKEPEDVRNAAFTGSIPVARLQAAFFALYDAIHEEEERWVPPEEVSLEAEIETLGSTLKRQGKVEFRSYFAKQKTRLRLAVTRKGDTVSLKEMAEALEEDSLKIEEALHVLQEKYDKPDSGITLHHTGAGWSLTTKKMYDEWLSSLLGKQSPLSSSALETLAVVAFKEPVTRTEIEKIRGVSAGRVLAGLLEKGLIEERGRLDVPGRPILYGTTKRFLQCTGLSDISELRTRWSGKLDEGELF